MNDDTAGPPTLRTRSAEALTIVVGILLALAADAAWEYRGDRSDELEILEGLRAEFANAEREIQADIDSRNDILRWSRRLLEVRRGASPEPPADSLPEALYELISYRFYTPTHPVLEDVLASGRLELIRSDELRRLLMRYLQERDRIGVVDERERELAADRIEPFLEGRADLSVIAMPGAEDRRRQAEIQRFFTAIREPAFGSLMYYRFDRTEGAQGFAQSLLRVIQEVRRELE